MTSRRSFDTYAVRIVWPSRPGRLAGIVLDVPAESPSTWGNRSMWVQAFSLRSHRSS
jgi:hypothetical protein